MNPVDPKRLEISEKFIEQFGKFQTIETADGKKIRFALYKPEALDKWIEANGGVRDGEWIRPKTPGDWKALRELQSFRWFEEVGESFKVPVKKDHLADKCVLRVQGFGRTIPMDKAFIGAHMALGVPYAVFDWREDNLSSTGFFQDAEAAYQTVRKEGFEPQHIIPMGSCKSSFIIGKLKEDHHEEGMNIVLVQPPPSLEQMIQKQMGLVRFLAMKSIGTIETKPGDYDTVARLQRLTPKDTPSLCLILSEGDTTIPADTKEQFLKATKDPIDLVIQHTEDGTDAHQLEPLRDPTVFDRYTQFLQKA
jgi:hypothetical protein